MNSSIIRRPTPLPPVESVTITLSLYEVKVLLHSFGSAQLGVVKGSTAYAFRKLLEEAAS